MVIFWCRYVFQFGIPDVFGFCSAFARHLRGFGVLLFVKLWLETRFPAVSRTSHERLTSVASSFFVCFSPVCFPPVCLFVSDCFMFCDFRVFASVFSRLATRNDTPRHACIFVCVLCCFLSFFFSRRGPCPFRRRHPWRWFLELVADRRIPLFLAAPEAQGRMSGV